MDSSNLKAKEKQNENWLSQKKDFLVIMVIQMKRLKARQSARARAADLAPSQKNHGAQIPESACGGEGGGGQDRG